MHNLVQRVITSIILISLVVLAFYFRGIFLTILLGTLSLLCCLEVANMILKERGLGITIAILSWFGLFCPLMFGADISAMLLFGGPSIIAILMIVLFCSSIKIEHFEKIASIFLWSSYISIGLACVHFLTDRPFAGESGLGVKVLAIALIVTFSNDTFAYLFGRSFGNRLLFERVSGKKTWEGLMAGITLSIAMVFLIRFIFVIFNIDWLTGLSKSDLLWLALPSSILAPIGDLVESRLKRFYDVKDSSRLLPGHGGFLDRIDGLLLVLPWAALYAFFIRPLC